MADTKYVGSDLLVTIDGAEAICGVTVTESRDVIEIPAGNKIGKMKEDGKLDITGSLTLTYYKGDLSRKLTGTTVNSGPSSDTQLHAGLTAPGAIGTETTTDMTTTDAQYGVIRLQALTAAVTGAGKVIIDGTDINGNPQQEEILVPLLGINESTYGKKVFKDTHHAWAQDYIQAGGTLKVWTAAKASSVTPGKATTVDIVVKAIKSTTGKYVELTMPGCFFTKESFSAADANAHIGQPLDFVMKDVNLFGKKYLD